LKLGAACACQSWNSDGFCSEFNEWQAVEAMNIDGYQAAGRLSLLSSWPR
jgi:hypothetical protein